MCKFDSSWCFLVAVALLQAFWNPRASGQDLDYRQEMRGFVQSISAFAKGIDPDFVVIPQNGQNLITLDGEADGPLAQEYVDAIDGIGREDLYYGYENDNEATPPGTTAALVAFLDRAEASGVEVLVTDYCSTPAFVEDSYTRNEARDYISFAADDRELRTIPAVPATPHNENALSIATLGDARNFLYLLNPEEYSTREAYLAALANTNHDIVLIDLFALDLEDGTQLTPAEVSGLKVKRDGGARLVIAYMSIGEAGDFRYYWRPEFNTNPPSWLADANPNFPGNFLVRYWMPDWQAIIVGDDSYLERIVDAGFDGVYLDIIDAFEFFEDGNGTPDPDGEGCASGGVAKRSDDMLLLVAVALLLALRPLLRFIPHRRRFQRSN